MLIVNLFYILPALFIDSFLTLLLYCFSQTALNKYIIFSSIGSIVFFFFCFKLILRIHPGALKIIKSDNALEFRCHKLTTFINPLGYVLNLVHLIVMKKMRVRKLQIEYYLLLGVLYLLLHIYLARIGHMLSWLQFFNIIVFLRLV